MHNSPLERLCECVCVRVCVCETHELIFSLAFKQIEICVPYLSWVWGFQHAYFYLYFVYVALLSMCCHGILFVYMVVRYMCMFASLGRIYMYIYIYAKKTLYKMKIGTGKKKTEKQQHSHCKSKQHCVEETTIVDPVYSICFACSFFSVCSFHMICFCFFFHQSIAHSLHFICFENEVLYALCILFFWV